MELVIKIPKEIYERIKDGYVPLGISKYLKNGTPLPEGHGRLIDADALYDQFEYADYDFEETLEYAPTIIEKDGD